MPRTINYKLELDTNGLEILPVARGELMARTITNLYGVLEYFDVSHEGIMSEKKLTSGILGGVLGGGDIGKIKKQLEAIPAAGLLNAQVVFDNGKKVNFARLVLGTMDGFEHWANIHTGDMQRFQKEMAADLRPLADRIKAAMNETGIDRSNLPDPRGTVTAATISEGQSGVSAVEQEARQLTDELKASPALQWLANTATITTEVEVIGNGVKVPTLDIHVSTISPENAEVLGLELAKVGLHPERRFNSQDPVIHVEREENVEILQNIVTALRKNYGGAKHVGNENLGMTSPSAGGSKPLDGGEIKK
ncbi:MAG TPA: hypothetical protein VKY19_14185 [Ktedonosporobacter sp.]|jgi:hypothetical protein|nr:hypothetical protein [Ktedonosporobacter sp.]